MHAVVSATTHEHPQLLPMLLLLLLLVLLLAHSGIRTSFGL
jgi:hypothetical protein